MVRFTNLDQYPPNDQELTEEEMELFYANQLEMAQVQSFEFLQYNYYSTKFIALLLYLETVQF